MGDASYEAAVKSTFETKPLRTVLMIDDEFPTLADMSELVSGVRQQEDPRFRQKDLAISLYNAFRKNDMLCDIENVADEVRPDRIRKSDLIILDYHLGPGSENSEKSISILRSLASSKHFNTVVVYTAERDLDKVWLEIVASLGGAWTTLPGELEGDAKEAWERLSDEGKLPTAPLDAVMEYAQRRNIRSLSQNVRRTMQDELVALGVPPPACGEFIEALINVEMAKRAGPYKSEPRHATVGGYDNSRRWIQSKNTFVTILNKRRELSDSEGDPAGIMDCLSKALLSWRPNLIQVLVSEIQNILELEALISDDDLLRQPATHAALWYFLIEALGPLDADTSPDVRVPLTALIDRIMEGVRRRLATDPDLLKLASGALLGELRDIGWTAQTWPTGKARVSAAADISRTKGLTTGQDTFFRLNSFLGSEAFRRAHITTGTLIQHRASGDYFVVASPACDLVPRQPSSEQHWTTAIHPLRPLVCIRLEAGVRIDAALASADQGRHIFLEEGGNKLVFAIVQSGPPSYELIFVEGAGIVREEEGKKIFRAGRIAPKLPSADSPGDVGVLAADEREWTYDTFDVVGQLRSANASRILQLAGQHLSRIGLDFISMPS